MADEFRLHLKEITSPGVNHFAVTASDSVDFAFKPRALYVSVAGTAVIVDEDDVAVSYTLAAGSVVPFRAKRVNSTGTTATLVAWY